MKFLNIEFCGIFGYGDKINFLEFNKNSSLSLIVGESGNGKTSIANAIKWCLYGKVDGYTIKDIKNRHSDYGYVKLELVVQNKHILVKRSTPNVIEYEVDGVNFERAGKKFEQEDLEKLLNINYTTFCNLVIVSGMNFKSFIGMKESDKKITIEKLFGFDMLSTMENNLKEKKKEKKIEYKNAENLFELSKKNYNSVLTQLETTYEDIDIDTIKNNIQTLLEKQKETNDKISLLNERKKFLTNDIKELEDKIKKKNWEFNQTSKQIELYNKGKCPTCNSDLTTDLHISLKNNFIDLNNLNQIEKKEFENNINELKKQFFEIEEKQKKGLDIDNKIKANLNDLKYKITLNENNKSKKQKIESIIKDLEFEYNKNLETYNNISSELGEWELLEKYLFSNDSIKSNINAVTIPFINEIIQENLKDIKLNFNVYFDANWDINIEQMGEEINVNTLSTGEKKRIDLIIILSMIELLEKKVGGMNLLFLDEFLSSLDSGTIVNMIYILKKKSIDLNINLFLISHVEIQEGQFDNIISVKKNGLVSEMNVN